MKAAMLGEKARRKNTDHKSHSTHAHGGHERARALARLTLTSAAVTEALAGTAYCLNGESTVSSCANDGTPAPPVDRRKCRLPDVPPVSLRGSAPQYQRHPDRTTENAATHRLG